MSYLDQMERLLDQHEARLGINATYSIEFVREGSFEVKVTVREPAPECSAIFDLKCGFTPATHRAIKAWYEAILLRELTPPAEPSPAAAIEAEEEKPEPRAISKTQPAGFLRAMRKLVPAPRHV